MQGWNLNKYVYIIIPFDIYIIKPYTEYFNKFEFSQKNQKSRIGCVSIYIYIWKTCAKVVYIYYTYIYT